MKYGHISVWRNDKPRDITLWIGQTDFHAAVNISPEVARRLIKDIQDELDKLPAAVTAADLGIEGAPV